MSIRSANLYVSPQLYRWLGWLAEMRSSENDKATADSMAEEILRDAILRNVPNIEALEKDYWTARRKLDAGVVEKMREGTASYARSERDE